MSLTELPANATLPRLLKRNAEQHGGAPAMREKSLGIWRTLSWSDYYELVAQIALGLASLGFKRGDVVALLGDNRPRLYAVQLAAQCLGGMPAPLYQDAPAEELLYVLEHAEATIVVAEDQEQVDKIQSIRARLPKLRLLVYEDKRGMFHYRDEGLRDFEAVLAMGREFGAQHPDFVAMQIAQGAPDEVALLCYTSGTTGRPKGVMLSHANLLASGRSFLAQTDLRPDDDWLAYLPMAWIGDGVYTLVLQLMVGFACNCPESPETVQRDLRELGPSAFLAAPRIWENLLTQIQVKATDASWIKRKIFEFFRDQAIAAELLRTDAKPVPPGLRVLLAVGEFMVFGPVRDQMGLRRARWCLTGGAPLGADTFRFFRAFGVNLKQLYGSTEMSAFVSVQSDNEANPNTVGPPGTDIEVRIADSGEVLVRGANVFRGYLKQEEATREAIDADGWFHTGDAGFIDPQGHLAIIDRAKDVGRLTDGTPFAPQFVENKLKFSPYIGEAISFGNDREKVTAMVAIALASVASWAERQGLAYSGYQDLTQKAEVRGLIRAEIEKCNQGLLAATRVRRFLLLAKDFDADDAEITRTRKLRRRVIAEKYAGVIDALYSEATETEIATEITYEDGKRATVRSRVAIEDVNV